MDAVPVAHHVRRPGAQGALGQRAVAIVGVGRLPLPADAVGAGVGLRQAPLAVVAVARVERVGRAGLVGHARYAACVGAVGVVHPLVLLDTPQYKILIVFCRFC